MRYRTCLGRLNHSFARRISRLEGVATLIAGKSGHDIDRAVAFVVIEALSAWSGFAREFYLSCAFLYPKTISGPHVSHNDASIVSERAALVRSILELKGKSVTGATIPARDEPTWHEKRAIPNLSKGLAFSNHQSVLNGFSYQTTFFDELPPIRNFYAHRSMGTAARVLRIGNKKYAAAAARHPNDLVNTLFAGRVQTLIQEWLGDMKEIGVTICT